MTVLMAGNAQFGRILAVVGAGVLAVSVFLPWYSVRLSADGTAYAQVALNAAAQRYGNSTLQAEANSIGSTFTNATGHQIATVTAHEYLKTISVVLLILAAVAFLGALLWLAEVEEPVRVSGGQIAAVGGVALLLVLYRMVDHPSTEFFSLSLGWGIWLALLSSVAVVAGGLLGRTPSQSSREVAIAPLA
jgi:hypothetical protein